MTLNIPQTRQVLRNFDFKALFIEFLGWDRHSASHEITIDEKKFCLHAVAQKRGVVAFLCETSANGSSLDYQMRRRIETMVEKSHHEHIIVFVDENGGNQIWQWVKREIGKPLASREHVYHRSQSGDSLIQKLQSLAFSIEEEEKLTLPDVTRGLRAGFDVEPVIKRFYKDFETEHETFLKFIKGISEEGMQRWYASVMLDRLMFIYFLQSKNFLDNDPRYLQNRLQQHRGKNRYYQEFLCHLFFEGFAVRKNKRSQTTNKLLGQVPYLNGGLFLRHQIETENENRIQIADAAFSKLFGFFDKWDWRLDSRRFRNDNEINPDILGYIFEKLINQKQMGAYYTKEDITEYIGKNTIIPFLFDAAEKKCPNAFAEVSQSTGSIWSLLRDNPDRYIYEAVKKGVRQPLPNNIAAGIAEVPKRGDWNKPAAEEFALPTEIWREVVARRQRYEEIYAKMTRGEIHSINDLITYNLNIRQFAQDVVVRCDDPELLHSIYHVIEKLTVLDPTCGSGAFLFAALNILEPLYEACLDRMEGFLAENASTNGKQNADPLSGFREILERVNEHSNRRYFILKAIIVNNLFGVDIMEEAVEICKLRLFLKLAAQAEKDDSKPNLGIEPLPDIDFNIRAGNTLVGFATRQEVKDWITLELKTGQYKMRQMLSGDALERIEVKAKEVDDLFASFRQQQTEDNINATPIEKEKLQKKLDELRDELNRYFAAEYGVSQNQSSAYDKWLKSNKPFHWFVEFYGVMKSGGFDVIIGNPPYVEHASKIQAEYRVRNFRTLECGNLYAFVTERCLSLSSKLNHMGLIVPLPSINTIRMLPLQSLIKPNFRSSGRCLWVSSYDERPSGLFTGVDQRLLVELFGKVTDHPSLFTTGIIRWSANVRCQLFSTLFYTIQDEMSMKFTKSILKIKDNRIEGEILKKFYVNESIEKFRVVHRTNELVSYRTAGGRYWKIALDRPFSSKTLSGKVANLKGLTGRQAAALISSSTFWWYYSCHFDMYNLGDYIIFGFRFNKPSDINSERLNELGRKLIDSLELNAKIQVVQSKTRGKVESKLYVANKSKSIIDEIDHVLAQHYGFTDEELDFIINYDIKYRMGNTAEEE